MHHLSLHAPVVAGAPSFRGHIELANMHTSQEKAQRCLAEKSCTAQRTQPQAAPVNIHITTPQQALQQPYQGYAPPPQVRPFLCTGTAQVARVLSTQPTAHQLPSHESNSWLAPFSAWILTLNSHMGPLLAA